MIDAALVLNKSIYVVILVLLFCVDASAQNYNKTDLRLHVNAIQKIIDNLPWHDSISPDSIFILTALRYKTAGPEIARLSSICTFCDWNNAPDSLDLPHERFTEFLNKNDGVKVIFTPIENKEHSDLHLFFSPLIPTKIPKHFAIQCNSFRYGERHYRLALLRKKGKRLTYVCDIYHMFSVY